MLDMHSRNKSRINRLQLASPNIWGAALGMLWGGQSVNNQLTGYSPPVNNTLIYANTNNRLHLGIVIPVGDHGLLMVVTSLDIYSALYTSIHKLSCSF